MIIEYKETRLKKIFSRISNKFPRWNYSKINVDLLNAASIFKDWTFEKETQLTATILEQKINSDLLEVADLSMLRSTGLRMECTYWWNAELSDLRKEVQKNRRMLSRARKKWSELSMEFIRYIENH